MNINFSKKIKETIIFFFRHLENEHSNNVNNKTLNNQSQNQQLRELYIYIAALLIIIITILGGYALYRKCIEKKALEEIEREYQIMVMNLLNSASSQISSSQEDNRQNSCNINQNNLENFEIEENPNFYNSLDHNHEERMENIRNKFGNALVIKCLLKKQIEEIQYTKNISEEYGDNCTICMENFMEHSIISKTPCEHIFHKKCFDKYLKEIQKKDKLLCPNCNQNLLINKKFLKLRTKIRKVEIKRKVDGKKEIKESEINLENEMKNRNSVMTNKNEDIVANNKDNEIIFIKKKFKKEKIKINKINDNKSIKIVNIKEKSEGNIYNPLQIKIKKNVSESKNDIDTILPNNTDQTANKKVDKKEEENIKILKRNIVIIKNDKNISLKNSLNSNESKESKGRLNNKKFKLNINDAGSECDRIAVGKNYFSPPSSKED